MYREKVVSSTIAAIGYDEKNQILEIEFHDASVYEYLGVPSDVHAQMMRAQSHGDFLNEEIKRAGYPCRQI